MSSFYYISVYLLFTLTVDKQILSFQAQRHEKEFQPTVTEMFSLTGRHRCIGENFAYVQIKTIWSTMLRLYEFDLIDGYFPTVNYTTMIHTPENPVIRYKRRSK